MIDFGYGMTFGTVEGRASLPGASLIVDFHADDLNMLLAADAPVSAWTARVGGIVASGTSTARPLLKKAWVGGRSYVKFDGVNDLLETTSFFDSSYNAAFTMVVVRDYAGLEPSSGYLTMTASNNAGANTWVTQYNRSTTALIIANLTASVQFFPASNAVAVEVWTFDGTTVTHRHNGVATALTIPGNLGLSGPMGLGNYPGGGFPGSPYIRRLAIYKKCLSPSECRAVEAICYADSGMRGRKMNYYLGDSQTLGTAATSGNDYPAYVEHALGATYNNARNAVAGRTLANMLANYATEVRPNLMSGVQNRVIVRAGTNDLYFGANAVPTFADLQSLCDLVRADGAKVAVCTLMKRTDVGTPAGFETRRSSLNTLIDGAGASLADAIVHLGNSTLYPEFANTADATYFVDLVHNTDAGNSIVAIGNGGGAGAGGVLEALNAL